MEFVFGAFGLPCSNLVKPIRSIFSWIKFPPKNKYPSDRTPHVKTKCIVQDKREHTLPKLQLMILTQMINFYGVKGVGKGKGNITPGK